MARLGDIVTVSPSTLENTNEQVWLLNLDMVEQKTGNILAYNYVSKKELNGSIIQFDTGNVLYSKLRPNLNKVVLPLQAGYATSEMLPLRPNVDIITREYLAIYLRSNCFATWASSKTAGAKMPRLGTKDLLNKEIPLPSLVKQQEIVDVTNSISKLTLLYKQQLVKLDELVKARFVEMFGEPIQNPLKWPQVQLSEVIREKASNGYFAKREEYTNTGNASILGVANVVNRMYSQCDGLPKTNITDDNIKKLKLQYGDVLFCRSSLVAEGIGKASIVPKDVPNNTVFECHVIRVPLNTDICVPEFIQVLTTTDYYRHQVLRHAKTATMTTISQDGILNTNIILPPIHIQESFYTFVSQVEKSKAAVQNALDKAQLLFDSLMQKYFG